MKINPVVGIIGGKGLIGSCFADVFHKAGLTVLLSDLHTKLKNRELIERSDIVAFSVPLHQTPAIIKKLMPHTRKEQLLIDFASIKTPAIKAMLRSKASVIGLHPMFRPTKNLGIKNQTIVMCPARAPTETQKFLKNILTRAGAIVTTMNASKHDELMAVVQALTHFRAIVFGNTLRKLRVNIRETLSCMSPVYRLEFDLMGRIFAQDPLLYAAIQLHNPKAKRVLKILEEETRRLNELIEQGSMKKFIKMFSKTGKFLGRHKEKSLAESNFLLQFFAKRPYTASDDKNFRHKSR
ncbi:MAG: Prephenate dehydrogenase [Candidatus Peregrinibacteria bacterium GW2011_GWA2_47_7]|nr:MAG: Prephenate dehydrogenase [Candidatus Peregrinibacteria bacterium GW2011_GWA2_47_7]